MTGLIILDQNGDREPDYWITDMMPNGTFVKIAEVLNTDIGSRVSCQIISLAKQQSHAIIQSLNCTTRYNAMFPSK